MIETLKQWDTSLFLLINGAHSSFWDQVMWFVSARLTWLPLYLLIAFLIIRKFRHKSIIILLLIVPLLILISDQLSVHLFKNVFHRLRPCHDPDIQNLVHLVRNHCGGRYGFVSSHASNSVGLAVLSILLLRNRIFLWAILAWALLVSYSRIYLGVHFPGDVLAGGMFGFLAGALAWYAYRVIDYYWLSRSRSFNKQY